MKKQIKQTKEKLNEVIHELEELSQQSEIKKILLGEDFRESLSAIIELFIPRAQFIIKQLNKAYEKIPKTHKQGNY